MSIAAIGSVGVSQVSNIQRNYQQIRSEFKQLGQDLQTCNLTQAQTDFVTLSQSVAAQFGSSSPIAKTLNTIGQALQSGNLAAAQQAFSSLPAGLGGAAVGQVRHHSGGMHTKFQSLLDQLGQALQSGNISAAQQAFSAIQQIWQQVPPTAVPTPTAIATTTGIVSGALNTTL